MNKWSNSVLFSDKMITARLHNVAVRKNCLQTLNTYTRVSLKSAKHLFSGKGHIH